MQKSAGCGSETLLKANRSKRDEYASSRDTRAKRFFANAGIKGSSQIEARCGGAWVATSTK